MRHKFSAKEIAFQAGVSLATVDRVLNNRGGVRAPTLARVTAAITEMETQFAAAKAHGQKIVVDFVMEAPDRFSSAVKSAFEAELPATRPASFRVRFHMAQSMDTQDTLRLLDTIKRRGSQGVILKIRDVPAIRAIVEDMKRSGIPVVTFATDINTPHRLAYVGIDNRKAGASAAWLMGQILGRQDGLILVTQSQRDFSGEGERISEFRQTIADYFPNLGLVEVTDGAGLARKTGQLVERALLDSPAIFGVYSASGGNQAILDAFANAKRACQAFAAHDLDATNTALLKNRDLTFVVHHDLRADARRTSQHFLKFHGILPQTFTVTESEFSIITPYSLS